MFLPMENQNKEHARSALWIRLSTLFLPPYIMDEKSSLHIFKCSLSYLNFNIEVIFRCFTYDFRSLYMEFMELVHLTLSKHLGVINL